MAVNVVLYLSVDGDSVTPAVTIDSRNSWSGERPVSADAGDLATTRRATDVANRVLDFAEGIKR